jgi:hypothetical protein
VRFDVVEDLLWEEEGARARCDEHGVAIRVASGSSGRTTPTPPRLKHHEEPNLQRLQTRASPATKHREAALIHPLAAEAGQVEKRSLRLSSTFLDRHHWRGRLQIGSKGSGEWAGTVAGERRWRGEMSRDF